MRVLISNDDGIFANGIKALRERLEQEDEIEKIFVAAPDRERSAIGHGITMHRPLRAKEVKYPSPKSAGWLVDGTPADCVKLALEELLEAPPDLVVSGINRGSNLGTDVLYSGTVSAAVEAVLNGFPAVAVSLTDYVEEDYTIAADFTARLVHLVHREGLPPGTLLNVNVPPGKPAGVKIVRLGNMKYVNIFDRRTDPRGRVYYWMAGEILDLEDNCPDTDVGASRRGYITVTPVQTDLTNHCEIERIKLWRL
ncbi:MAG: 5'/3'-nucleotidase SurE [Peptococcaceae bacterium]|nr:5'/3'-nucleotidase SurE [Peptococcaceae bacterium]